MTERLRTSVSDDPVVATTVLRTFELLAATADEAGDEPSRRFLTAERQRLADVTERAGFGVE